MNVLDYKRNDSLVFDAAGKCILSLHSPEDMKPSPGQKGLSAVGSGGSSKGKKCPAEPVQKATVLPKKRRRIVIDGDDEDGDEDDNLLDIRFSKHQALYLPDQSIEGVSLVLPDATQN